MSNFTKRVIFGLLYAVSILVSYYFGPIYFYTLFFLFMLLSLYEFLKLIELKSIYPYILAVTSFLLTILSNGEPLSLEEHVLQKLIFSAFTLVLFITFITALVSSRKIAIQYLGRIFLSLIYIIIPFSLMAKLPFLNMDKSFDFTTIIGIFILIWSNDVFAYLVGKNFGKHKLIERVSPNKTIEGFVGGLVFTFVSAYFISRFLNVLPPSHWFSLAFIVSIFGVLGDLVESMFKRQANIKDSSNLIPGHGGFLDRLDSIIFVTPFIYIYLYLFI